MKIVGITLVTFIILFSYSLDTQGLSLSSAIVSVTDSLNNTLSTQTDINGAYTINNITQGAFSGNITKGGYTTYNFSGTMSPPDRQ